MKEQDFDNLSEADLLSVIMSVSRQHRRSLQRQAAKAAQQSPKHLVNIPAPGEYDGMPPETAADCLTGYRNSNTFRKTCKAARERIITPNNPPSGTLADRKIREMNFRQLCSAFNRSFRARFQHIPLAMSKLNVDRVFVDRRRIIGDKAVKFCMERQQALNFSREMHDEIIRRVSIEINRRHANHLGAANV